MAFDSFHNRQPLRAFQDQFAEMNISRLNQAEQTHRAETVTPKGGQAAMATTFGLTRNKGAPSRPMPGKVEEPEVGVDDMGINEITDPKLHLKLRNPRSLSSQRL
jgi:hypothetical protein